MALLGDIKHVVDAFDESCERVANVQQSLVARLTAALSFLLLCERCANNRLELVMLAAESDYVVQSLEHWVLSKNLQFLLDVTTFSQAMVAAARSATNGGLELLNGVFPLSFDVVDF